jgi:hypothetical protein
MDAAFFAFGQVSYVSTSMTLFVVELVAFS